MKMAIWWGFAAATVAGGAGPPVPGLEDVCAHLPQRCSPEICNIAAGDHIQLEARTYYQDRVVILPTGARVVGAGINRTVIVNCGAPSTQMRGFILGNDTYIGNFTWQGHSPNRGPFSGVVQTPGCADTGACNLTRCIPSGGDCAGAANVIVEHIHVRPFDNGSHWWPLVNDAAWFPRTAPWGPDRATGSRNITIRGLISWGTWADGINFHGGHHNVLVEDCEISYTGDDPYGLWPDSVQANENRGNCQQNIVLRNNIGRWPRQARGGHDVRVAAGHYAPRDFAACGCNDHKCEKGGNWHCCFATYGGGSGVQFLNNHCEGAHGVVRFLAAYPWSVKNETLYCGPVAVAANTYAAMAGQGQGCRPDHSTQGWCEKTNFSGGQPAPMPPVTIGGQCQSSEPSLPPRCRDAYSLCAQTPGVAGVCYNETAVDVVQCVSATELADMAERSAMCKGFSSVCTLY